MTDVLKSPNSDPEVTYRRSAPFDALLTAPHDSVVVISFGNLAESPKTRDYLHTYFGVDPEEDEPVVYFERRRMGVHNNNGSGIVLHFFHEGEQANETTVYDGNGQSPFEYVEGSGPGSGITVFKSSLDTFNGNYKVAVLPLTY